MTLDQCAGSEIRNIILASFRRKISPSPLWQRGVRIARRIPPLKKGDKGGFELNFRGCHHLDFLNELLRRHTS